MNMTQRIIEGFLELNPPPKLEPVPEPEHEHVNHVLQNIRTIPQFMERIHDEPDFLRTVFDGGKYLWIKRRWSDRFLAYIRVTDTPPRGGSWLKRSYLQPLTFERVHGDECKWIAETLVDSGLAVFSKKHEPFCNRMMRRGLKAYNNFKFRMRIW